MKKAIALIICVIMIISAVPSAGAQDAASFDDVPSTHWAHGFISELRRLGITDGVGGNRFGLGQTISRAEFATFMCKIMGWQQLSPTSGRFSDNQTPSAWYYGYIEAAAAGGAVPSGGEFRPLDPITREEMAVMLVRALGYDTLAVQLEYLGSPFPDVSSYTGHITVARDLGIISGMSAQQFAPKGTALREHAAAILIKMLECLGNAPQYHNAFFAISSASQMQNMGKFDSVSFGWSRLGIGEDGSPSLNVARSSTNEYGVPQGYDEPFGLASGGDRLLMVSVSNADAAKIIGEKNLHASAVQLLTNAAQGILGPDGQPLAFDGIVVDFEGLGSGLKALYVDFLTLLREGLNNKLMAVAVHPQRREGHAYYGGYDYRAIGELADRVILMAHDYNAKRLTEDEMARGIIMTPAAPIDEVYYALRSITDEETGVRDRSKVVLQFSFASVQWKTRDGAVINQTPYTPAFASVYERIRSGAEMQYSKKHESPYITFYNGDDNTDNIVWYEDARSVKAKQDLALLFGVTGFSYWRLGEIPDGPVDLHLNVLDIAIT